MKYTCMMCTLKLPSNKENITIRDKISDSETLEENVEHQGNGEIEGNSVVSEILDSIVGETMGEDGVEISDMEECKRMLQAKDEYLKQVLQEQKAKHIAVVEELKDKQRNEILTINDHFNKVREKNEDLNAKNNNLKDKHRETLGNINEQLNKVRSEKDELRRENEGLKAVSYTHLTLPTKA